MTSVNILSDRYTEELPNLEAGLIQWKENLLRLAEQIDPNAHIDGRVKKLPSLLTKAYKNGPENARTWDAFGDLVALKAIFPTVGGAEAFTNLLESDCRTQNISCELDRRRPSPEKLEYSSDQFDLCDPEIRDGLGNGLKVEVQVRTVSGDAWYMIDHRLRYKNATKLPGDLQRRVLRLIVLTELFDSEVDSLIKDVNTFESKTSAGLFNKLRKIFSEFTESHAPALKPEGLFEILLSVYSEDDQKALEEKLQQLIDHDGARIRKVISEHTYGADNYVEKYDWLYMQPEALLVADLARKPRLLASAVANTDFDQLVNNMAEELRVG